MAALTVVRIEHLSKRFAGRPALDDVSLEIKPGEFIGLLGSNGAGKSTLIKILDGVYAADSGKVHGCTPADVGVVHQDLGLIDDLTVAENLAFGDRSLRRSPLNSTSGRATARRQSEVLAAVGLSVPLDRHVRELHAAERALLAVARLLQAEPRLIILDEVTSALSSTEARSVIVSLRARTTTNVPIIMVSHKLSEITELATRVVVLRDGRLFADMQGPFDAPAELAALIAPPVDARARAVSESFTGAPLLVAADVRADGVGPLSLTIRPGEAVGLTGRLGSRLHDISLLLAGRTKPRSGSLTFAGRRRPGFVAPTRETHANFPELSVQWNETVGSLGRWRNRFGLLRLRREFHDADASSRSLSLVPDDITRHQRTLSGGNQQKALFARAMFAPSSLYVLCEPTRGVDPATRSQLYDLIWRLREAGSAVVVASSDLEDITSTCDRVLLVEDGRFTLERETRDLDAPHLAELL